MKLSPRPLFVLITAACLVAFYMFIVKPFDTAFSNMPSGHDADQAYSLWRFVTNRVFFDGKSATNPSEPSVYCDPFHNSARLTVYGVTNTERQEGVLSAIREWQKANGTCRSCPCASMSARIISFLPIIKLLTRAGTGSRKFYFGKSLLC